MLWDPWISSRAILLTQNGPVLSATAGLLSLNSSPELMWPEAAEHAQMPNSAAGNRRLQQSSEGTNGTDDRLRPSVLQELVQNTVLLAAHDVLQQGSGVILSSGDGQGWRLQGGQG